MLLERALRKIHDETVVVASLKVIVEVPKLDQHHDTVLRASVHRETAEHDRRTTITNDTPLMQRNKKKNTRSKWPECRRIRDMPDALTSCLPRHCTCYFSPNPSLVPALTACTCLDQCRGTTYVPIFQPCYTPSGVNMERKCS